MSGTLSFGTVPISFQFAAQSATVTIISEGVLPESESESESENDDEDETEEEMDEVDNVDEAIHEDATEDDEAAELPASAQPQPQTDEPTIQPQLTATLPTYLTEIDQILSDDNYSLGDDDSEMPDLEVEVADETDQETITEGNNESLHHQFQQPAHQLSCPAVTEQVDSDPNETTRFPTPTSHANPTSPTLPFNLLQTSQHDIRLIRDLTTPTPAPTTAYVLCKQALTQTLPPGYSSLAHTERLNMLAQIPDLGLVLVANQVGRVGVLTLTRWERAEHAPQSGFRIEAILPTREEEERGLRPKRAALAGLAVARVQGDGEGDGDGGGGFRRRGGPRRWRVLLFYCDHTVLSYEISRPDGVGDEGGVLVL